MIYLPSLHQKRVPPHLRLSVDLEPEEGGKSSDFSLYFTTIISTLHPSCLYNHPFLVTHELQEHKTTKAAAEQNQF